MNWYTVLESQNQPSTTFFLPFLPTFPFPASILTLWQRLSVSVQEKRQEKGEGKRERGWTGHLFKPLLRCHVDRAGGQIGTLKSIGFFSRHGTRPLHGDEFELHPPIDRKARWLLGQASNCSTRQFHNYSTSTVQDRGKSSNSTSII